MKGKITIKTLIEKIDTGTTIYKIDEQNSKIHLIEGIVVSNENPNILISKYKIDFTKELKDFIATNKFQNASYKPVKRGVILIDIVGYSKGNSLYFAAILTVFNTIINHTLRKLKTINKLVEQIIPTGDGCYLVFNENQNQSFFKIVLIIINEMNNQQNDILKKFSKKQNSENNLHLRISCTLNETDFFYDVAGNRNCYGIGLNEASRILTSGQNEVLKKFPNANTFDSVFFDKTVLNQAISLTKKLGNNYLHKTSILDLGQVADKHNVKRNIWWLKNLHLDNSIDLYFDGKGPFIA